MADIQQASNPDAQPKPEVQKQPENPVKPAAKPESKEPSAPAKPLEQPTASAAKDPEEKWPRSAEEWKKFREARKKREEELTAEIESHKTKLAEYEKKTKENTAAPNPEEVESLKKEREELSKRLELVDVTQHPQFQQYFGGKTERAINLAKAIVGPALAEKVAALLKQPDSEWKSQQLDDIGLELSPTAQGRLGGVLNQLSEIESERQLAIANASEEYKQIQAKNADKTKQQQARFEGFVAKVTGEVTDPKNGMAAYQKRDNDLLWNSAVDARIERAKSILTGKGLTAEQVIKAAFQAEALGPVLEENLSLRGHISKLEEQVKKLQSAEPRLEQPTGGAKKESESPKQGQRPMDISRSWAKTMVDAMTRPDE